MKTYRLAEDVYAETIDAGGRAVQEGWLPAGTEVAPCGGAGDTSPWTGAPRGNHGGGLCVRVVRTADGRDGRGLAREVLQEGRSGRAIDTVADLAAVAEVAR